ncbi:MAG: sulfite exporter TauE/SafE family protein [Chlorobi bacterium]|nr:sulfite exporter TauE/SafE family protein [Chlorobiota bacterium]
MNEIIILLIIGLVAGLASGTLGIGGGIIIVPSLVFIMGFSQHMAQGTSLAFLLPPIGVFAVYTYYKNNYINFKFAIVLTIAFVAGAYLGSLISLNLDDKILKKIFAGFMILVALKMIFTD